MAIITWTGSGGVPTNTLNQANNWNPPTAGGGSGGNRYDFNSSAVNSPTATSGYIMGAMLMDPSYTRDGGVITLVPTGNFAFTSPTNETANGYAVYLYANKVFWVNSSTRSLINGTPTTVYLESGAQLRLGSYLGTAGFARVFGPGKLYLVYGATAGTVLATGKGIQIADGTVAIRGTDYAANAANIILGATGYIEFVSGYAGSGTFNVESGGGSKTFGVTVYFPDGGTFKVDSGSTLNFSTTPSFAGGSGGPRALTLSGVGTLGFTGSGFNNPLSINFTANGTLVVPTGSTLSGATLSGTGTVACQGTWGVTVQTDAPTFTGSITGDFLFGGTNKTFNGNVVNNCDMVAGSSWTFTGASSGAINAVGANCTANVRGSFGATSGTTVLVNGGSVLAFYGSGSFNAGRTIEAASNAGSVTLQESSTGLVSPITETGAAGVLTFGVEDATACTYSGTLTVSSATTTPLKIRSKGTFTLSGTIAGGAAGRTVNLNSDAGYTGTIKVTGAGFTASSPLTLTYGTLDLTASSPSLGGGLTAAANSTVKLPVSSTSTIRRINGNMTLAANSILKFAA